MTMAAGGVAATFWDLPAFATDMGAPPGCAAARSRPRARHGAKLIARPGEGNKEAAKQHRPIRDSGLAPPRAVVPGGGRAALKDPPYLRPGRRAGSAVGGSAPIEP